MLAILKRELRNYYTSVFAYLYYAVFFLVLGIFFAMNCLTTYSTQFSYYVLSRGFLVIVAVLPFCTMKLFSLERKNKTDQLLFTAPVSSFSILVAKYLATVIFAMLPLVLSVIYPVIISMHGEMSVRYEVAGYIGCVLVMLVFLSIGMFISALSTNTVLVVVISYSIYAIVLLSRVVEVLVPEGKMYSFLSNISIYNKYNDMISGIVRSGDVFYLLIITIGFFLLTWIVLECRRLNIRKMVLLTFLVLFVGGGLSIISLAFTKVYDFTAERLLTLSSQTKEVVSQITKVTDIYYMGKESQTNATYRELLNAYKMLNNNISVHYIDAENDPTFKQEYLSDVYAISTASILVVAGERSIYLDSSDYVTTSQVTAHSYESILEIEQQLTSAIYYTNSDETDKLCLISGHSEETLNSDFKNLLLLNNYELEDIDISYAITSFDDVIPEDCKAVLVNAPQSDFTVEEIEELESYLQSGGDLFVILDPLTEDNENLYEFLRKYGLDVQQGVVIEQEEGCYAYDTAHYVVPTIQENEYTKNIIDKDLTVLTMTSKGIITEGKVNGYTCTDVLTTSTKAFSKVGNYEDMTSKSEEDISGPFSVASCAENPNEGSIFLLTSNVFFNEQADNESLGANRKFFLEIMKQLTDTKSSIWIDGKDMGSQVALYPYNSRAIMKVIAIVIVPMSIFLIGIGIVVVRKRNIIFQILKKRNENDEKQETDTCN